MELALRVRAEFGQAHGEVKALREGLQQMGPAAAGIDSGGLEKVGQASATAAKAAAEQASETAKATTATQAQAGASNQAAAATQKQAGAAGQAATASQKQASASNQAAAASKAEAAAHQQAEGAMRRKRKAVDDAAKGNAAGAMSAKAYAAAMRNVPAQITDITVGLLTGQPAYMVALQQGGQLKDLFGGLRPAAKALASAFLGMVNPLTLAGAGVGALALAYYQGSQEADAYRRAIVMSGNAAGVTTDQLATMAARIDDTVGTTRQASAAVAALAGTGEVSGRSLERLAETSVRMQRDLGFSLEEVVDDFAALGDEPVEASLKLNKQYRYLTSAVYEQIKALAEQGRQEDAAELAQKTYASAMDQRARTMEANMGYIERAWRGVTDAASEAWDAMLGIGRAKTLEQQIKEATAHVERLRNLASGEQFGETAGGAATGNPRRQTAAKRQLGMAESELNRLELIRAIDAQDAAFAALEQKRSKAMQTASEAWGARAKALRSNSEKLKEEVAEIRKQGDLLKRPQAEIDGQIKATEAKYADKSKKSDPVGSAYQQQLQQLQVARATAAQNLANAQDNVNAGQEQATVRLDAWLAVNKNALKLSDERIAKLREEAEEIDRLNKATREATEGRARRERITAGMADVGTAMAQAQGRTAEASAAAVLERFRKLRADLEKEGDLAGLVKVDNLVRVESARAQFDDLQRQAERILGEQSRAEQSLSTRVTAGLTGELDARRQILDLNAATAQQLQGLLPRMRELAEITGNPAMVDGVRDLETRVGGLSIRANELQRAFTDAFGGSMVSALQDLADGTAGLGEAVLGFLNDLAEGMARWASEQLAMRAQSSLISLFNAGTGNGAESAADASGGAAAVAGTVAALTTSTAAATADAAATTAATAATTALTPAMAAATTAAGTLATALAAAATAASANAGASGANGIMGAVSAYAGSSVSAATGGHIRGPGTGTSDSIAAWLSDGEFVSRASVVRQPGALDFLHDFNRRGMAALHSRIGFATGGLVVSDADLGLPRASTYTPAITTGSTSVDNRIALNLIDDPARLTDAISSPAGVAALEVVLSRNPSKFRQILNVNG
ncbi:Phage tail length tape-measure protein 1 [plant metagenome]